MESQRWMMKFRTIDGNTAVRDEGCREFENIRNPVYKQCTHKKDKLLGEEGEAVVQELYHRKLEFVGAHGMGFQLDFSLVVAMAVADPKKQYYNSPFSRR
eukprot:TRINITY_DN22343_c0_g1_i1.p2 TRINITY_DN22343_c0_g1~~TRINITY_DN22343_c0_g1_i1.p2  ORF type:complete len:100 (+),score=14.87 TRINITY_DN22343_c0_g1_i1:64-363(+)